jgi:hypothetical protein
MSMTSEQKKKLLIAKIAVALLHVKGRVPTEEEIQHHYEHVVVSCKAVLGLHYKRQEQKKNGQLAMF